MSDTKAEAPAKDDATIEALLSSAAPRPAPPEDRIADVRDAVRAEWQKSTVSRRRTTRLTRMAAAAAVVAAVYVTLNALQTNGIAPQTVATIDRQVGLVRILGEGAKLLDGGELAHVTSGQILDTGQDSGASLSWSDGGALRVDADSRLEFLSESEVRLHSGRIYFDSKPALGVRAAADDPVLTISTEFGSVTHVGTRYMTSVDRRGITVSVRDGMVRTTSSAGREFEVGGRQQLNVTRSGSGTTSNIKPYGRAWEWVEQVSPGVSLDGRTVFEFLDWVSHETGLTLSFDSTGAEAYARQETLNGQLDVSPRQALDVWMLGTDLNWQIDSSTGVIHVTSRN